MTSINLNNLWKNAYKLFLNKDYVQSKVIANKILKLDSNFPAAILLIADIEMANKNFNLAIESFLKVLPHYNNNKNLYNSLSLCYAKLNNFDLAIKYSHESLLLDQKSYLVNNNLGFYYSKINNFEMAIKFYNKAIDYKNDYRLAYINLGQLFQSLSRYDEAIKLYKNYLMQFKDKVILSDLGICLSFLKNYRDAEIYFVEALNIDNLYLPALVNLSNLYLNTRRFDEAIELLLKAISIDDSNPKVYNNLGVAYLNLHLLDESMAALNKSIELNPSYSSALANLASVMNQKNLVEDAYICALKAFKIDNNNFIACNNLGLYYRSKGDYKKSKNFFKKSLNINPNFYESLNSLIEVDDYYEPDQIFYNLKSKFDNCDLQNYEIAPIGFAIFTLFDRKGNYKEAFKYLNKANNIKDNNLSSYKLEENIFKINKKIFTNDLVNKISNKANRDKTPIFIIGMPRSGTTLLEQILSCHSKISSYGELNFISESYKNNFINKFSNKTDKVQYIRDDLLKKSDDDFLFLSNQYLNEVKKTTNLKNIFFTDKLPANFLNIGYIKLLFPNSKIINLLRSPMDNCFSIYTLNFSNFHPYSYNLKKISKYYNEYLNIMNHWHDLFPNQIYNLSYESLVNNHEYEVRSIFKYLNLNFETACLDFYKSKRTVKTASNKQVRRAIFKSSISRWKHYKAELNELKTCLESYNIIP